MLTTEYSALLDAVTALNAANVPAVGEADRAKIERLVEMSWRSLVALSEADELLGFCIVFEPGAPYESVNYRWFEARYEDFVYLDRVAVAEHARGRGIGRALYDEVAAAAAGRGQFTLEVNLEPRNDESLAFHHRLGFVEVGQQTTDYGFVVSLQSRPLSPLPTRQGVNEVAVTATSLTPWRVGSGGGSGGGSRGGERGRGVDGVSGGRGGSGTGRARR